MAEPTERLYLAYGDNGMRLAYSGDDPAAFASACHELAERAAGYVSGYQFVGRMRVDLRCYLDHPPDTRFLALRSRRELFDLAWHPAAAAAPE